MACASKLVPRHPRRVQNTSISRDRIECGSIRLAPERPGTFPFDALFVSLLVSPQGNVDGATNLLTDSCQHVTTQCMALSTSESRKTRRMAGHAAQQHVLLECPGICQLVDTMKSSVPDHRLDTAIWKFTAPFNTSPVSCDNSPALAYRSTDSEAVALSIIGLNIAICHNYDAEVGGPLKGPLKKESKKGHFHFTKTSSPKKLRTVSVLSQSSRLVSW